MVTTPVGGARAPPRRWGEAGLAAGGLCSPGCFLGGREGVGSIDSRVAGPLACSQNGECGSAPRSPKVAGLEEAACSEHVSKARLVRRQDLVPGLGFPLVRVTRVGGFPSLLSLCTAPGSELWGWIHRTLTNLPHRYPRLPNRCQGPAWKLGLSLMLCNLLVSC